MLYIFLVSHFQHLNHFLILCSGYRFAEGIQKNYKEVADLHNLYARMMCNCLVYFSQNPQIQNWRIKLVRTLFTSCSLLSTCFPFSLFLFCLPDMCACQICAPGKIKTNASRLQLASQPASQVNDLSQVASWAVGSLAKPASELARYVCTCCINKKWQYQLNSFITLKL